MESNTSPDQLAILVVGTETLIKALPARPVQLANACGALGFDLVIPLSWGDELIAEAVVQALEFRGPDPALLATCPHVRKRLVQSGLELTGAMVSLISPPVALARYLRSTLGSHIGSLSFAGRCPGAIPPDYDTVYDPDELFAMFKDRGMEPEGQPDVFYDRVPADRSRYFSLPGGCPTTDVLWRQCNERLLVEPDPDPELSVGIAQHLLTPKSVLVDLGPALGCSCSGVTPSTAGISARIAVTSIEPPRSTIPVVSHSLDRSLLAEEIVIQAAPLSGSAERAPMAITPASAFKPISIVR